MFGPGRRRPRISPPRLLILPDPSVRPADFRLATGQPGPPMGVHRQAVNTDAGRRRAPRGFRGRAGGHVARSVPPRPRRPDPIHQPGPAAPAKREPH